MRRSSLAVGAIVAVLLIAGALLLPRWRILFHSPLEVPIAGGDGGGLPLAQPEDEHFDVVALERGRADPAAAGLSAWMVLRHGHLVSEHYAHGLGRDSEVDFGAAAQALLAMLAGVVVADHTLPAEQFGPFDASAWKASIERAAQRPYAELLSRSLWSRLNAARAWIELPAAGAAVPADCCVHARLQDWLRVGALLTDQGRFEGTQIVPSHWIDRIMTQGLGVERTTSCAWHGALRGPGCDLSAGTGALADLGVTEPAPVGAVRQRRRAGRRRWRCRPRQLGRDASAQSGHRSGHGPILTQRRPVAVAAARAESLIAPSVQSPGRFKPLWALCIVVVIDVLGFGVLIPLIPYMALRDRAPPALNTRDPRHLFALSTAGRAAVGTSQRSAGATTHPADQHAGGLWLISDSGIRALTRGAVPIARARRLHGRKPRGRHGVRVRHQYTDRPRQNHGHGRCIDRDRVHARPGHRRAARRGTSGGRQFPAPGAVVGSAQFGCDDAGAVPAAREPRAVPLIGGERRNRHSLRAYPSGSC